MKELARRILVVLDPDELPLLDSLPDTVPDPRRGKRIRTGPTDAGMAEAVMVLAPAVMWVAQCVANAIIEYQVQKSMGRRWKLFGRSRSGETRVDVTQAMATAEGWAIVQVTVVSSGEHAGLSTEQITKVLEVLRPGRRSGDEKNVGEE